MFGKNIASLKESSIGFALASVMLNVLILFILCSASWTVYSLTTQAGMLNVFLTETSGDKNKISQIKF